MELAGTREKHLSARNRIPGAVAQKRPASFEKKMDLELGGTVRMVAAVPGQPVAPGKPVDEHRIYYFHEFSIPGNRPYTVN